MAERLSLRLRALLLAVAMGIALSMLFAASVVTITERYEHVLVAALLQDQAEMQAARLAADPDAVLPGSARLRAHLRRLGDATNRIPAHLAPLPSGIHELHSTDDDGLHVGVFDTANGRLYLEVDLADVEALEHFQRRIVLLIIVAGIVISTLLGWWLARSVARPVRGLADAVDALPDQPQATQLATAMPRDALGRLAHAIDRYQSRLLSADQAQQRFLADASHELRTPVAVVRGAVELLQEDAAGHPELQPVVQRLQRGVDELTLQLDATLRLARRQFATPEPVVMDVWLPPLLERLLRSRPAPVRLQVSGHAGTRRLPVRDAELVIAAGIQHLLAQGQAGMLEVRLDGDSIDALFRPDAASAAHPQPSARSRPQARSDRGLGASILGTLAAVHGWQYDDGRLDEGRLRIMLPATSGPGTGTGMQAV